MSYRLTQLTVRTSGAKTRSQYEAEGTFVHPRYATLASYISAPSRRLLTSACGDVGVYKGQNSSPSLGHHLAKVVHSKVVANRSLETHKIDPHTELGFE